MSVSFFIQLYIISQKPSGKDKIFYRAFAIIPLAKKAKGARNGKKNSGNGR